MQAHNPDYYIGGVYIDQNGVWCGEFVATARELWEYAEHDVKTVAEFDVVLTMLQAQQEYLLWWESIQYGK